MKNDFSFIIQQGLIILVIIILIVILLLGLIGQLDKIRRLIWGVESGVLYQGKNLGGYLPQEVKRIVLISAKELTIYPISGEDSSKIEGKILDISITVEKILEAESEEVRPVLFNIAPY